MASGNQNLTSYQANKWTNLRAFTIKDSDSTNAGTSTNVDGTGAITLYLPSTIKGTFTGNASSATKLETAREIYVALGSTRDTNNKVTFNGTADKAIHVSGTLGVARGGTNKSSWTASRLIYSSATDTLANSSITTDGGYLGSVSYLSINTAHQTNYRLYVNGNTLNNGIEYFANGTTYYINNSGTANLNALTANGTSTFKGTIRINNEVNNARLYARGNANTADWGYFGFVRGNPGDGDLYYTTRFRALYYSYNDSTKARLDTYEYFDLPTVNAGLTENKSYSILTTKNTVTIAQGGTGATTAQDATWNLLHVANPGDLNTAKRMGNFKISNTTTNTPVSSMWGATWNIVDDAAAGNNGTSGSTWQLVFQSGSTNAWLRCITNTGAWTAYAKLVTSSNYTDYTVTKTGSGASGSWGISVTGNAATATALTSNAGGGEQPIYFTNGKPSATSYALKATVNNGTAAYLAYYSGARAISSWSYAKFHDGCLSLFPTTSSYREGMRIHSAGSWSDITLCGNDNTGDSGTTANSWFLGNNNGNFYITRNGSSSGTSLFGCVGNVWKVYGNQSNSKSKQQSILHIYGATYGNTAADMISGTAGLFSWGDGGPQITFDTSETPGGSQAGALIFTDHDTAATGASWHFVSNQSDWNVTSKRFHARTSISIGSNLPNTSYNFVLNGTANHTTGYWYINGGAGGIINGAATNGGLNSIRIGDDVWLGDCNQGGMMGMKSTGANTGFYFYNSSGTNTGQFYTNGTNFVCNKPISRAGVSRSWINGRDTAIIRTTSYSGYDAILSMKTTAGAWELGVYTDNKMYFTYTPDSKYNASDNSGYVQMRLDPNGYLYPARCYNAVWNDYAEFRECETLTPGMCVKENDNGKLTITNTRLIPGSSIISDTYGFAEGETDIAKTPIAVSGRVLAYTYRPREEYHAGMAVCSAPNGTIDIMTRDEIMMYPDAIVGIVSEIPEYEEWGTGNIKIDGRIWIKVK